MQKTKKREWVKTVAIIFLSVLLVLTFFSNTIRNRSLPEVAAKYVESGSINAKIRGTGAVSANEVYEVKLSQTRKIESVLVRVGDEVKAGDPLFKLESMDSDELKQAKADLRALQVAYQQKLMTQGNEDSKENRDIQKLRDDYNEALKIYQVYSTMDPSSIALAVKDSEEDLRKMKQEVSRIEAEIAKLEASLKVSKEEQALRLQKLKDLDTEMKKLQLQKESIIATMNSLKNDFAIYRAAYEEMENAAKNHGSSNGKTLREKMEYYVNHPEELRSYVSNAEASIQAYNILSADVKAVMGYIDSDAPVLPPQEGDGGAVVAAAAALDDDLTIKQQYDAVNAAQIAKITTIEKNIQLAQSEYDKISVESNTITAEEATLKSYQQQLQSVNDSVNAQQGVVDKYNAAKGAADTLRTAQKALEDKLFEASLGNPESLTFQADAEAIELKKQEVEELTKDAEGGEVTAKVSGTISAINVTAGGNAGADQAIATITVADRGYVVKVPVTVEQARQVRIGDTAEVTNYYWGDIKATLENIAADPDSGGKGKLLIFRITGEGVEAGSNLTLSIGQKSTNYDCLIPKSAIRSDSNGSFVLVVTAKSSPLGNRYIATRADVQVLAEDDTKAAVSGLAYGDFVITTSTKPLEAGDMVRLVENG